MKRTYPVFLVVILIFVTLTGCTGQLPTNKEAAGETTKPAINQSTAATEENTQPSASQSPATAQETTKPGVNQSTIVYTNNEYKFSFTLPGGWKGYKIIDDKWDDDKGASEKVVNKCMYHKYQHDLGICNAILSKYSNKVTFKDIIARELNVDKDRIVDREITEEKLTLEEYLEGIVGKKLFKDEQKELIERINLRDNRNRIQKSSELFNVYFKENKISYIILHKKDSSRKSETYGKRYWEITENIYK
jgi:hypothetical protein